MRTIVQQHFSPSSSPFPRLPCESSASYSSVCVWASSIERSLRSDEHVRADLCLSSAVGALPLITLYLLLGWCDPAAVCTRSPGTNRLFDLRSLKSQSRSLSNHFLASYPPSWPRAPLSPWLPGCCEWGQVQPCYLVDHNPALCWPEEGNLLYSVIKHLTTF